MDENAMKAGVKMAAQSVLCGFTNSVTVRANNFLCCLLK